MTEETKEKIRIARFKTLYGDDWRVVLEAKHGPEWEKILADRRKSKPHLLSKPETLAIIQQDITDPKIRADIRADLLRLWCDVRKWVGVRSRPLKGKQLAPLKPTESE